MARLESCPTCGNQTSENASQCPDCGEPLSPGWADTVREQREQKAEEANRAAVEAALVQKKAKRNKRLVWVSIFAVLIVWIIGPGMYDDFELRNLQETDPAEYQMRIQKLEAQVAKVRASNFKKNIRLYSELQKLNPDSAQYADKIAHYQRKQKEAEAEAKAAKAKARAKAEAAEVAAEAAAEAAKRRKGFHCLSGWDGSHREVKNYTEQRMRDPGSFEHIETRITPVNANGEHTLIMKYSAKNGFGGTTVGIVTATIRNAGCSATILSLE